MCGVLPSTPLTFKLGAILLCDECPVHKSLSSHRGQQDTGVHPTHSAHLLSVALNISTKPRLDGSIRGANGAPLRVIESSIWFGKNIGDVLQLRGCKWQLCKQQMRIYVSATQVEGSGLSCGELWLAINAYIAIVRPA